MADRYPEIVPPRSRRLPGGLVLDGELVVPSTAGRSDFEELRRRKPAAAAADDPGGRCGVARGADRVRSAPGDGRGSTHAAVARSAVQRCTSTLCRDPGCN